VVITLAAAPYFLLAQLAQIKGDFNLSKECLNKALYLDSRFVAAVPGTGCTMRARRCMPRAQNLRRGRFGDRPQLPNNEMIEQYEITAGALTQWLRTVGGRTTEAPLNPTQRN